MFVSIAFISPLTTPANHDMLNVVALKLDSLLNAHLSVELRQMQRQNHSFLSKHGDKPHDNSNWQVFLFGFHAV